MQTIGLLIILMSATSAYAGEDAMTSVQEYWLAEAQCAARPIHDLPPCGYSERMPASKKPCTLWRRAD